MGCFVGFTESDSVSGYFLPQMMITFTTNYSVKSWPCVKLMCCGEVLGVNSPFFGAEQYTGPSVSSEMVSTQEEQAGHTRPPSRTRADHRDSKALIATPWILASAWEKQRSHNSHSVQ